MEFGQIEQSFFNFDCDRLIDILKTELKVESIFVDLNHVDDVDCEKNNVFDNQIKNPRGQ